MTNGSLSENCYFLSFILAFSFVVSCLVWGSAPQTAINNPITEEDYEILKENALTVAKTSKDLKGSLSIVWVM